MSALVARLRAIASALPSDGSAVTFTRADLLALLDGADVADQPAAERDLSVDDVAAETGRAGSTVRGWLIAGALDGYKLRGRDWRITRAALRAFLARQGQPDPAPETDPADVDIAAWRKIGGGG